MGLARCRAFFLSIALIVAGVAGAEVRFDMGDGSDDLRDALRAASLLVTTDADDTATVQDRVAAARADYGRLLAVLYEYGYFGPTLSIRINGAEAANLSPFSPPARVTEMDIRVTPGRGFRLGRAEIGPLAPGTELPEGFRPGAPANTPILRHSAEAAITGWRSVGHATADIAGQTITARQDEAVLDADITVAPGRLIRFGDLIPQGQQRTRPERIVEIAGLPRGAVFDPDTLENAAQRLRRTGTFRSVALEERTPDADAIMDIGATLVEAPLRRIGFGAEISSSDGITLSSYWLHRNLLGGAERLRFDAEISGIGGDTGGTDWELAGVFSRPATFRPDTTMIFDVRLAGLDETTFRETLFETSLGFERIVSDELTVELGIGLRASDISDAFGDRDVLLATFPARATYDRRDNPLDARAGYFAELDLTPFVVLDGAGNGLGLRATLDARGYLGIGAENRTRLAGRLQLGTIDGGAFTDLPPEFLFFSGGGDTVRGQPYQSLGALQGGISSGGRGFAGLSAEIRTDITDTYGLVAFADGGYISAGSLGDTDGDWHAGAGLGLRYNTALGPIRLDVATPVTGDDAGNRVLFYIGIGHAF
ncbi:outer membrane protein assembly factor [Rhodophyticola sp. CCM32]|uniref:autotransporter assembly complex protein TamA n=1 Tax=Rhodophyticola sp. CCM32 TaxID=2916397 RepID=UPI00107FC243|nr:BamA/TamA family outer membrane protein [Rhodophyticola sp. CCM32]QBY02028.1 outer membrane protein assembly factor [Rhodophyticola sp. CCM32]